MLVRYLAQFRKAKTSEASRTQRFVAVEVAPEKTTGELTVLLARNRRIEVGRGFDALTLQRLVAALEA